MSLLYCPNCGTKIDNKPKFCPNCGTSIEKQNTIPEETIIKKIYNNIELQNNKVFQKAKALAIITIIIGIANILLTYILPSNSDNSIILDFPSVGYYILIYLLFIITIKKANTKILNIILIIHYFILIFDLILTHLLIFSDIATIENFLITYNFNSTFSASFSYIHTFITLIYYICMIIFIIAILKKKKRQYKLLKNICLYSLVFLNIFTILLTNTIQISATTFITSTIGSISMIIFTLFTYQHANSIYKEENNNKI